MQFTSETVGTAAPKFDQAPFAAFSDIVGSLGRDGFADTLLKICDAAFGIDNCSIFKLSSYKLVEVAGASLAGAEALRTEYLSAYDVKRVLSQVGSEQARVEVQAIGIAGQLARPQRLFISAQRGHDHFCIGMLRSSARGAMAIDKMRQLRELADFLLALVARHIELVSDKFNATPVLNSLSDIQNCLMTETELSKREAEVCARILFGMSSYGIASDLGIGKESVMTYRKRAYQRMGIATQRELLMWYLAQKSTSETIPTGPWAAAN